MEHIKATFFQKEICMFFYTLYDDTNFDTKKTNTENINTVLLFTAIIQWLSDIVHVYIYVLNFTLSSEEVALRNSDTLKKIQVL